LKTNRAPSQLLQEVALAVLGHSNSSELTDDHTRSNVASSAGKTSYENHSTSFMNNSNIQTLTVKRPSSKPSFHQNSSDDVEKAAPFSPLSHCGRITSAAMAHAIYMARKNKINQSSQALHPFLDIEYQTSTHLNDVNEIDVSQASLPTPKPSKFPPYSPKIVSGSELGGVMYGPKLGSFPPSLSPNTTLTLPTVPIPPTFSELQSRLSGNIPSSSSTVQLASLFKSTLPRYSREQFAEKCRQEPFVVRTIAHLSKEGLWSERRLPKVCERPRPQTHWDGMLKEMQWLAVDFHQERKWKRAAAKMLAYSAKEFVAHWEEQKRFKKEQKEKQLRTVAKFVSVEIARFWKTIKALHYDNSLSNSISSSENNHYLGCQRNLNAEIPFSRSETYSYEQSSRIIAGESGQSIIVNNLEGIPIKKPVKRRSTSSNGSSNCMSVPLNALTCINDIVNDEEDDDVDLFELEENEINASDDDELTIEEQEAFEAENTLIDRRLEWDTLSSDNQKTVEILLRSNYSAYLNALNDNTLEDIDTIEDSSGVEDGGSDSDDDSTVGNSLENEDYRLEIESMDTFNHHDFDLDAVEKVLHIPLSRKQRFLYDDYMAGPDVRKALEGDGQTLSTVLNNLRKFATIQAWYQVLKQGTNRVIQTSL
jgi:hypothetical protein